MVTTHSLLASRGVPRGSENHTQDARGKTLGLAPIDEYKMELMHAGTEERWVKSQMSGLFSLEILHRGPKIVRRTRFSKKGS